MQELKIKALAFSRTLECYVLMHYNLPFCNFHDLRSGMNLEKKNLMDVTKNDLAKCQTKINILCLYIGWHKMPIHSGNLANICGFFKI